MKILQIGGIIAATMLNAGSGHILGLSALPVVDTALLENQTGCHKPGQSTKTFVWAFWSSLSVA